MQRRLSAILAADVVGYSRLMEADEAGTLAALKALRHDLLDPKIAEHNGRTVKLMGDGALVEFASVLDAVECALEIQRAMAGHDADAGNDRRIRFRIGINLGDVIIDGDDIYGDGVNVAARLEALAEPDGICISSVVHESLGRRVDAEFADAGEYEVKNISRPIRVFRWPADGTDTVMPSAAVLALPDKPSIAVLPFANRSNDPDQEFFADGITEDIITALSQVRWLFVIARNSTFAYKGTSPDVRAVAEQLGVRYVLEGSVRTGSNRVRINAQLIDAASGNQVWAQRFDRQLQDIFDLQDEMTDIIVAAVEPELASMKRERARRKPPENLNAWECYQRGLWHVYRFTRDDNVDAQRLFRRAVEIDPDFAGGYAGLADAQYFAMMHGYSESHGETLTEAFKAAQRAVSLDNKDAGARYSLGKLFYMRREHDAAILELRAAVALNPNLADAYYGLGTSLFFAGQASEAIAPLKDALRLSPHDPHRWIFYVCLSLSHLQLGEYEATLEWATMAIREPASEVTANVALVSCLGHLGKIEEGARAVTELLQRNPGISREYLNNIFPYKNEAHFEQVFDGLRKAGLPE